MQPPSPNVIRMFTNHCSHHSRRGERCSSARRNVTNSPKVNANTKNLYAGRPIAAPTFIILKSEFNFQKDGIIPLIIFLIVVSL